MFPPCKKSSMKSTERVREKEGGRRFCCIQNSLSLPDDTVWEPANACIVPASRLPTFPPLVFLAPTAFGPLQTGGSSSPIVSFERDEENQPLPLSFLPSLPSLVLSLSLSVLLSIPSPRDRAHLPDLGCRRPHSDQPSACRATHRLQPSLDLRIFVCSSALSCTYR